LNLVFGTSRDTSDFVADCLEPWWTHRHAAHPGVRRLLINLDNGPEIGSSRTQFMKRLVDFSDRHQLTLKLACYPPYHSKYNRIERCRGILENHRAVRAGCQGAELRNPPRRVRRGLERAFRI
jgi:hypothetical protein